MSIGSGHGPAGQDERERNPERRPGKPWILALAALILTFTVMACYDLISKSGDLGAGSATAAAGSTSSAAESASPGSATARSSGSASASRASSSPTVSHAPHPLSVTSVAAFGPEGTSDGDNPDVAARVLDVSTDLPWYSQWYATPDFGNLRSGTGLLLTLGKAASVRDIRLVLGSAPGADIQVRVGNSPAPDLPVVADASDVAGTVLLTAAKSATGRYVLIWFTRLPPDGHGHYQVNVFNVGVDG